MQKTGTVPAAREEHFAPEGTFSPPASLLAEIWKLAGLERDAAGLTRLARCDFPLAQFIAGSALLRKESRGAHLRSDFPQVDPALDQMHTVIGPDSNAEMERWD